MRDRVDVVAVEPPGVARDPLQDRALITGEGGGARGRRHHENRRRHDGGGDQSTDPHPTVNVAGVTEVRSELSLTHNLNGPGWTANWPLLS